MDASIAGFVALGTLIVGLFAWLRQDIRELREQMNERVNELRERVARIEGLLEAMFIRRDLTPFPEPPPPTDLPDKTRAA